MKGLKLEPGWRFGLGHAVELAAIEVEAAGQSDNRPVVRVERDQRTLHVGDLGEGPAVARLAARG